MSSNPLKDDPKRDAAIRHEARLLWEADGKPACGPEGYIEKATDLIAIKGVPQGTPVKDLPPPELDGVEIDDARAGVDVDADPNHNFD
ncbi:hypothetical protein [Gluconobacter oxydans]|uniref:hypothetical protein n=1 Tax=Gluconobacter oxydans TaxID=442 RepID=UPI0039EA233B